MDNISNGFGSTIKYIKEINEALIDIQKKYNSKFEDKLLFSYRGESKDYGKTRLMPSIFRDYDFLSKEKYLFELMSDYSLVNNEASYIDKLIHAQHYIEISRILDITFNSLVALYFACDSNYNDDGAVYIFGFPKHFSPSSSYIIDYYVNMLNDNYISYSRNFRVITHSFSNERIKAQSGGFIFFPGDDFYPINDCYYRKVDITSSDKEEVLKGLDVLFDISKHKIFPEKENVTKEVKKKFNSSEYEKHSVTYEDEIKFYFNRISFELELSQKEPIDAMRFLRKEKEDLIDYVNHFVDENKQEYIDEITTFFKNATLIYGG